MSTAAGRPLSHAHIFPPALVPLLRSLPGGRRPCLDGVPDDLLRELVTVIFFAGLETHEAERQPVRVVFGGKGPPRTLVPDGRESAASATYRWRTLRFDEPRPFSIAELVKLRPATIDEGIYITVHVIGEALAITGLAREGANFDDDPFLELIVPRPGVLSVRSGRERLLEYEHGSVLNSAENLLLSEGLVRRALEAIARDAGVDRGTLSDYVRAIEAILREMASHRHGGILAVSPERDPRLPAGESYRLERDVSLADLLRLSRLLNGRGPASSAGGDLLRTAFLAETDRMIEEIGALTAIDGACVLNCDLALAAFGVKLPIDAGVPLAAAADPYGATQTPFDLISRGTRHAAAATYAHDHRGAVVFVASQDGPVTCFVRRGPHDAALGWRLA